MNVKDSKTPVSDAATARALASLKSCTTHEQFHESVKNVVSDLIKTCRELETRIKHTP